MHLKTILSVLRKELEKNGKIVATQYSLTSLIAKSGAVGKKDTEAGTWKLTRNFISTMGKN